MRTKATGSSRVFEFQCCGEVPWFLRGLEFWAFMVSGFRFRFLVLGCVV